MNISELSIKRPILATVIVLVIFLFGIIGYSYLGVREFPNIDNPIITVSVTYPGANAEVIEKQITEPLEQNINGTAGIRSLSSNSSQGQCRITIEFELSVPLEAAANDIRDKVSRAQRYLPKDCDPPTVAKADADANPIMQITVQSEKRSLLELSEIAELTVKERLQTVPNVSAVEIWGENRYAMKLWLDPVKMAAYKISPMDIRSAIERENVELPSGSIEGDNIELALKTSGLLQTPEDFNNLIIYKDKINVIRFKDIGTAELDTENRKNIMKRNGIPMVSTNILPQPGANQVEIADEARRRLEQMKKDLPEDVIVEVAFDNTQFVRASINEVKDTLFIAFALVVVVIFLFLRDWRVTLIPCVVIPISLVGAFFVMYLLGFSINVLSMLAVVLAVGLVVDDAIIVTENIYVKIEKGMTPIQAGIEGSKEIFFAVVSTTITLVAVFFPIVFMQGMTGRLFREFSLVVSGSIIISAFVALTFTPMIATKLLKKRKKQNWLYRVTEPFFDGLNNIYSKALRGFLSVKIIAIPIIILILGLIVFLWQNIPSEMAPLEDRSNITIRTQAPQGASFEYLRDYNDKIAKIADSLTPEKESIISMINGNWSMVRIILPPIKSRERSQMEIAKALTQRLSRETEARAFVQQQSSFGGQRSSMPIRYVLQAPNIEKLRNSIPLVMKKVNETPSMQMADVDLKFTKPEAQLIIDKEKASMLGVSTRDIGQTLQYSLSGQRLGYFYMNGKQYQIIAEINRQKRNTPLDLKSLYLKNSDGQMIQLDNLVKLRESVAPPQLYRYNRFSSATISAALTEGNTIGKALEDLDKIAAETLDESFRTALDGESKNYRESSSSLMFAFILALVLIYLILSAQFESFKDPFVIMFTVPLAISGALVFMFFKDITMNIFSQIGIIMLIGLVAKNGILIVEFANQRQAAGISKRQAIEESAVQRLRPILMTSVSTIFGLVPLVVASAEGANARIAMGTAVIGGMIISTFMTIFIVPAMYMFISTNRERKKARE